MAESLRKVLFGLLQAMKFKIKYKLGYNCSICPNLAHFILKIDALKKRMDKKITNSEFFILRTISTNSWDSILILKRKKIDPPPPPMCNHVIPNAQ
jgi:hypothetical protein